ncbi:ribonuclease P protein component [Jeotgalibaca caeni]|uniref:ribonuclease P protein component n=1 Tax=Jeotgalibaca caeni TaxID=3028623 RepID=UPI00237EB500|nr:ribonuclease P protein component [Jeotgalibaca caeni]MDE1548312.1 ribonuclease P protein component [Jeotgalibaca caeni]
MKKSFRVKKEKEFQMVFQSGSSKANRQFVVYTLPKPGQLHFRVGISVGKKVGNAVVRNAVKRKIRQALLELKPELKAEIDFIVIARPPAAKMSTEEVKKSLIHVLKLAHVLEKTM